MSTFDSAGVAAGRGGRLNDPNVVILGVTPKLNGSTTTTGTRAPNCKGQGGYCYYWSGALSTGYRTVWYIVATPTPATPSPTESPSCLCKSDNTCDSSCSFNKYSDVSYANPISCLRPATFPGATPSTSDKSAYCQRSMRTKGDVDGDGLVTNLDYYYYVAAVNGGGIPVGANPDVNGDGQVSPADRAIIVRTLSGQ